MFRPKSKSNYFAKHSRPLNRVRKKNLAGNGSL